ncbi:DUF2380 domain-containing protein [Mesorhizobium sp. WSM2239]|uniref:DUF2380 domain-containing protein n=2 Tax=unclassified Mesorhizobium TaxID=325217 RepID=A0AAU8DII1_9HYPH
MRHRRRLEELVSALTKQLEDSGRFEFGALACDDASCNGDEALGTARGGYGYVIFGAVQKTSSLVLWAKVKVVDADTAKLLFTRWITFRGDTDESWSRTGRYIGREMVKTGAK